MVADILALEKIKTEQSFLQGILYAGRERPAQHAMRGQSIGCTLDAFEIEGNVLFCPFRGNAGIDFLCSGRTAELGLQVARVCANSA